ncbi:MAG: HlyD family secretion protein, partial [Lutispora sp.]
MKNKSIILLFSMVLILFMTTGCKAKSEEEAAEEIRKPVKVIEIEERLNTKKLEYIGIVVPEEMKKIGFKTSGKIASIKVDKGQEVKKGDTLALLDTKELSLALEAAQAAKAGAEAQYMKAVNGATDEDLELAASNVVKAQKAYEFAKDSLDKAKKLYEGGGISKQDLDAAELEVTIREQEYISAKTILQQTEKGAREEDKLALKSQMEQAEADLRYKESALSDAV